MVDVGADAKRAERKEAHEESEAAKKPSEGTLALYRIFQTVMVSACTGLAGIAVAFLASMHNDIVDLRINGAAFVGKFELLNSRVDGAHSAISRQGSEIGALTGRVIVLEQNVKVK